MNQNHVQILFSDSSQTFAIVRLSFLKNVIVINFDFYVSSPHFQGIKGFDIFETKKEAIDFIKRKVKIIKKDTRDGLFILGLITDSPQSINSKPTVSLVIAKAVEEISLSNQKIIYRIKTIELISLNHNQFYQNAAKIPLLQNVNNLFCSFDLNITSLSNSEENCIFNIFHMYQAPFAHMAINPCPKVINGFVQYRHISENGYILLICRKIANKSENDETIESEYGIDTDGNIPNLTEIEIQISKQNSNNVDVSYFTISFGSMPFSYKIKGKNRDELKFPEYPFLNTPQFMMSFTKEKSKEVVFIDTSTNELSRILRQTVSFLSGVFRVESHQIDLSNSFSEILNSLPDIEITRRIYFDNYTREESSQNKLFYVASVDGCYGSLAASFIVLTKVFNSIIELENGKQILAELIWPFYVKFEGISNSLNDLAKLMNIQYNIQSPNSFDDNMFKRTFCLPPKERCVSLYPTATIVSPINVDPRILSFNQCQFFYRTPEQPIIINLTTPCIISRIIMMGIHTNSTTINACPSMVTIYGGLYLNQMFPIVENLVLSPIENTNFPIPNDDPASIDSPYNPDLLFSRFSKVRFLSFHFSSLFEAFYISNILIFTDDRKEISFKDEKIPKLSSYKDPIITSEVQRILDGDSQTLYLNKNHITYDYFNSVRTFFQNELKLKKTEKNKMIKNFQIQRAYKKYPFLLNSFEIENVMDLNSNVVPFIMASGPPPLESILYKNLTSNVKQSFEPKETLILLKIVFMQSYQIDSLEIKCQHPLTLEIINNSDFRIQNQSFDFSPPGNEYKICVKDRVLDLKIVGNPISLQSLTFKSNNQLFVETPINENQANNGPQLKVTNESRHLKQAEIDVGNKSIIGLKLKESFGIVHTMLILDGRVIQIKSYQDALFIFPKLVRKVGVVFKEDKSKYKKLSFLRVAPNQQADIEDILLKQPQSFEIVQT